MLSSISHGFAPIPTVRDTGRYLACFVLALVLHGGIALWLAFALPPVSRTASVVQLDVREAPPPKSTLGSPEPPKPISSPKTRIVRRHSYSPAPQPTQTPEPSSPPPKLFGIQPSAATPESNVAAPIGDTALADPKARRAATRPSDDGVPGGLGDGKDMPVIGPRYDAAYLHNAPPRYPPLARRLRLQGTTTIRVLVSVDGSPKSVKLERSSGVQILDQAALEAVRHWTFVPARQGNQPLAAEVNVPLHFRLEGVAAE